ncbi:hypothetical protein [Burkholderia gladioli]|uniref:hypothetical protein n=1 Tax=Burkholderia gladioli TaxID=28095 RepID=UPI00163EE55C|nr:hypothetical protein [Burkholderia gladioli]
MEIPTSDTFAILNQTVLNAMTGDEDGYAAAAARCRHRRTGSAILGRVAIRPRSPCARIHEADDTQHGVSD